MPNKLKYLFIHCAATPEGRDVTPATIEGWHLAPCDNADGTVTYKGKVYKNRTALPNDLIGGVSIKTLTGRGWSKGGYAAIITLDGKITTNVKDNGDNWVDAGEITNGVQGFNSVSKHVCYVGGMSSDMKTVKDTRTASQKIALEAYVKATISAHPDIQIIGHNQANDKACPSFSVPKWCASIGIAKKNIATVDPFGYAAKYKG